MHIVNVASCEKFTYSIMMTYVTLNLQHFVASESLCFVCVYSCIYFRHSVILSAGC
jgi:hypothetical protein